MIWYEGLDEWTKAKDISELKELALASPPPFVSDKTEPDNVITVEDLNKRKSLNSGWICKNCNNKIDNNFDMCWNCGADIMGNISNEIANDIKEIKKTKKKSTSTDPFAIISFAAGLGGFIILPILFVPVGYIASIVSYYRLKENKKLKGSGLRIIGAILTTANIFWLMYIYKIGIFND